MTRPHSLQAHLATEWIPGCKPKSGNSASKPAQSSFTPGEVRYRHLMCIMACIRSMHSVNPDSPRSDDSFPHLNSTLTKSIFFCTIVIVQ